ncbi:unconventional myosin-XVIIIb [Babesia ovis]|uniref:Unconventional myosin-XVIIIb n=1 Tax=Babesia ovis TaxID=5869 RepID=A0A9W5TD60_BABOV|nr:unconventional myosin-XVIIIb [Babesia ovis]
MASLDAKIGGTNPSKPFQRHEDATHRTATGTNETSEIQHLAKLKSDIDAAISRLQQSLQSKALTHTEWQKVNELRHAAKIKLDSANDRVNGLIKTVNVPSNRVLALQVQRYRRIFDQLTGEFGILAKQVDQRYRSFTLFGDDRHAIQPRDISANTGQVVVEAIMDVESLTEQAALNLGILRKVEMAEIAHLKLEVLELLHEPRASRLLSHLTEERLRKRQDKSKTIQSGRNVYDQLVKRLFEAGYFRQFGHYDGKVCEILCSSDVIEDGMATLAYDLGVSTYLGPAIFYMIVGWITVQMNLSDVDLYDIVTSYGLSESEDGRLAQILKHMVHMIIYTAGQHLQSEIRSESVDNDLRWLMHNGTVSGIYSRLKVLIQCAHIYYGINTDIVIVNTIALELGRLTRSRQIVLTRMLRHVTDAILGHKTPGVRNPSQKLSQHLWRLISEAVAQSGIKQLAYDDVELLVKLRSLGRDYDVSRLAMVLTEDTTSYVDDLEDFRKNCDYMGAICALKKYGLNWDYFDTFNLAKDNFGVVLMDRNPI